MSSERKVGVFVLATLVLIAGMILNFSKGRGLFASTYTVRVRSVEVGGLKKDAPVSISGVTVGNVTGIELTEDRRAVEVSARILSRYPIRSDARFSIDQSGFLGDQYVAIAPRGDTAPFLNDNDIVQAEQPFDLQETARSATALMGKLDVALDRINSAAKRLDEQLLTPATLTNLSASAANLRLATEEAVGTLADARTLLRTNAPAVAGALSNLSTITGTLKGTAIQLDAFVAEQRPALGTLVSNATETTGDLKRITADLREGRGSAGALLYDDGLRLQLGSAFTNLATASSNLARFGIFYKPRPPRVPSTNRMRLLGKDPTDPAR
ncbi:MAG: MCE family protein [Verrucomicrobia bacterium]|nr:MCE family protein [Verrucomicrobiota bacterium]